MFSARAMMLRKGSYSRCASHSSHGYLSLVGGDTAAIEEHYSPRWKSRTWCSKQQWLWPTMYTQWQLQNLYSPEIHKAHNIYQNKLSEQHCLYCGLLHKPSKRSCPAFGKPCNHCVIARSLHLRRTSFVREPLKGLLTPQTTESNLITSLRNRWWR